jgi:GTPase SAR1 family protein
MKRLYRTALDEGKKKWKSLKLMIVGDSGAGKTTLVRALQGQQLTDTRAVQSTDGIEVQTCTISADKKSTWFKGVQQPSLRYDDVIIHKVQSQPSHTLSDTPATQTNLNNDNISTDYELIARIQNANQNTTKSAEVKSRIIAKSTAPKKDPITASEEESIVLSVWDFAGQEIYQYSHSLFFSKRALYILVIDISRTDTEKLTQSIRYWIHCIHSHSVDAQILVVGTHSDLIIKKRKHPLWQLVTSKYSDISTPEEQLKYWLEDHVNETPIHRCDEVFIVSNKQLESVKDLRDMICARAEKLVEAYDEVPIKLAVFMEQMQKSRKELISLDEVNALCTKLRIHEDYKQLFLDTLEDFGFILNFSSTLRQGEGNNRQFMMTC